MKRVGNILKWLLLVGLFAACLPLYLYRQDIVDWYWLRHYTPPSQISAVADRTTMSPLGKKDFYVHDPQLMDKVEFNSYCHVQEATIVLGCYDGKGIYVYDVTEPKLDGVIEVTSAHEMLHAAYDRLSNADKKRIDVLLLQTIAGVTDQRILSVAASYQKANPATYVNELHSVIGTEVRSLSPELEHYYARYFSDRSAVVALSEKYEAVFTGIKQQVAAYDADLALRKAEIDNRQSAQTFEQQRLTAWRAQLDSLGRSDVSSYNQQVSSYNQAVNNYNQSIHELKTLIDEYNAIVAKRNDLALEQNSLVKSIDSRPEEL